MQKKGSLDMYLIPANELKKGDIILTAENSATSKIVRAATGSDFSHAILYVGSSSYIHSDANGVHSGNLQRLLFDTDKNVTILRVNCSEEVINEVCMFARTKIGTTYSVKDAINAKMKMNIKASDNRQFCSRLVVQAYEHAKIKLVRDTFFCTPQEILESDKTLVTSITPKKATDDEIDFSNSKNPIAIQSTITNEILSKTRGLTGKDVQTLNQITNYVIENPHHDKEISEIFKQSGYLTMWQYEITNNPWRYNGVIFLSLPLSRDKLVEMAKSEIESAKETHERFKINLRQYFIINEIHKLEYSLLHLELYKQLITNNLNQSEAAKYVLENAYKLKP